MVPRGDPPGFIHIVNDRTFVIPDRPGNNRLDTMSNIVANPNVACLFFIPGFEDTLRVSGKAAITADEDYMERLGLRETFARLRLTDVEPTVSPRYLTFFSRFNSFGSHFL